MDKVALQQAFSDTLVLVDTLSFVWDFPFIAVSFLSDGEPNSY